MTDSARYQRYFNAYQGDVPPPWDSGIVPPEVQALIAGESPLPPGQALDVGCGTGVSSVFLAQHGWQVTGVDWIQEAVDRAQVRAQAVGLDESNPRFLQVDVTSAEFLAGHPPVTFWLDIGCVHTFTPEARQIYAQHAARLVAPGGHMLLYLWGWAQVEGRVVGLDEAEVKTLFAPYFDLIRVEHGLEATNLSRPSAWYTLRRVGV